MDLVRTRYWGLAILVWLQLLDIVTTHAALANGAIEGNPFAYGVIDHGSYLSLFLFKAAIVGAFAYLVTQVGRRNAGYATLITWFGVGFYIAVVLINVSTLHHLGAV